MDTILGVWGTVNNFVLWSIAVFALPIASQFYKFLTLKGIGYKTDDLSKLRIFKGSLEKNIINLGVEVESLQSRESADLRQLLESESTSADELHDWFSGRELILGAFFEEIALNFLALQPESHQGVRYSLLAKVLNR